MNTRTGKVDFEQSLIDAFKKKNVVESITNLILNTITNELKEKFLTYDNKIAQLEADILELKTNISNNVPNLATIETEECKQKIVEQKLDSIQQHIKNNNIRLINFSETVNEDLHEKIISLFNNKLNVDMENENISSVYRVGRSNENKPRHVIISFKDNNKKMAVYNNKKLLKGSKIIMKEDLTINRLKCVTAASEKYGFKNVWTINGKIFVKNENGVEKISLE